MIPDRSAASAADVHRATPGYVYGVAVSSSRQEEGTPSCSCPCHVANSPRGARGWFCDQCFTYLAHCCWPEVEEVPYSHEQAMSDGKENPRPYMVMVPDYYFITKGNSLDDAFPRRHFKTEEAAERAVKKLNDADVPYRTQNVSPSFFNRSPFWETVESLDEVERDAELRADLRGRRVSADRSAASVGRYATIVADPPWKYATAATKADASKHYDTATLGEIMALRDVVAKLAEPNAHLWLWTTNAFIEEGYDVVRAWGFRPLTLVTWCKPGPGVGYYVRNNTEHCILASRGAPLVPEEKAMSSWWEWPRKEHSAKPDAFYDLVEQVSPGPYLEMFSRRARLGWDTWGDEALHGTELVA